MQLFVLHTICAAPIRVFLFKMGYNTFALHLVCGVLVSFALPVLIAWIAVKSQYLNFFFAPLKTMKKIEKIK